MALRRPLWLGVDNGTETTPGLQAIQDGDTIDPAVLPAGAAGPNTPASTTTGFLVKWGDTLGDSLAEGVAAPTGAVVGTTDTQTLTNKTLTTPTIASFANAGHTHESAGGGGTLNAAALAAGTVAPARLGSGTPDNTTFLRGDSTWQTIPGGGDALTSGTLAQFAATSSAELRGVLSDETGTGAAVFATSPTLVTPVLGTPASGTLTNCTGLPTAGLVDGAVTNAKAADMAEGTIKGRAAGAGTGDPTDLSAAQVLTITGAVAGPGSAVADRIVTFDGTTGKLVKDSGTLISGLQATSAKGAASGYAGLDALAMVPTAQQRPYEWDKTVYRLRKIPGQAAIGIEGPAITYDVDGVLTDNPGNGGSWGSIEDGGIITGYNVIQTRWNADLTWQIKTGPSLASHQFWIGIAASSLDGTTPLAAGSGNCSIALAAFAFDATVHSGDVAWYCTTSDGSGTNGATTTDSGVALTVDTTYTLRIKCNPSTPNVQFYINDTLVATHTTDLPSASTTLGILTRVTGTVLFKRLVVIHD